MYRQTAISGIARSMLTWITSAQHQRALAEDLAAHFLVVDRIGAVRHQVVALWRGEQPVGKLIALDHQPHRLLRLLLEIDDLLAFAAHVGRMQQPRGWCSMNSTMHRSPAQTAGSTVSDEQQPELALRPPDAFQNSTPSMRQRQDQQVRHDQRRRRAAENSCCTPR